jgi:hypothetical protein
MKNVSSASKIFFLFKNYNFGSKLSVSISAIFPAFSPSIGLLIKT